MRRSSAGCLRNCPRHLPRIGDLFRKDHRAGLAGRPGVAAVLGCPITAERSACGRVRRSVIGWSGRMGRPMSPELHQHRQMAEPFGAGPEATTGPGPATPMPWWSGSWRRALALTCSTWAVAPGSPPASSGRLVAGCSAWSPTPEWPNGRGRAVSRSGRRPSRTGTPRVGAFDAVIAGQRWVDPIAGAAKAAALLRLTGRLAAGRSHPGAHGRTPVPRRACRRRHSPGRRPRPRHCKLLLTGLRPSPTRRCGGDGHVGANWEAGADPRGKTDAAGGPGQAIVGSGRA